MDGAWGQMVEIPNTMRAFAVDWVDNFYSVVIAPRSSFAPDHPAGRHVDGKVVSFGFVSLVVAEFIASLVVPELKTVQFLAAWFMYLLLFWTIHISVYYFWARLVGGTASYQASIAAGIRVKGVITVLSALMAVSIAILTTLPEANKRILLDMIFGAIETVLAFIFIPIVFGSLNGFNTKRTILFAVAPITLTSGQGLLYIAVGLWLHLPFMLAGGK